MYIDPEWKDKKIYPVGCTFVANQRFKYRCCGFYCEKGTRFKVVQYTSKKVLGILTGEAFHKIKKGMITNYCNQEVKNE